MAELESSKQLEMLHTGLACGPVTLPVEIAKRQERFSPANFPFVTWHRLTSTLILA